MRLHPDEPKRLQLLNQVRLSTSTGIARPWSSCSETRRCVVCDAVFTGADVRINRLGAGRLVLRCPTARCTGSPEMWIHAGEPLVSQEAWSDWERILTFFDQSPAEEEFDAALSA